MIRRNEQFLTVSAILNAIRHRFVSVLAVTALISVAGLAMLLMLRDIYTSEGEFYLNAGRGTVTIDPSATTSQTASLMDTRQSEIQSIKDMLSSRMMLERTARRVGVDRILEQRSWLDRKKESIMSSIDDYLGMNDTLDDGLTGDQTADLNRLQGAVEYLADRLSITGDKEGNTVQIKSKAHTSLLAHDIVEELMAEFQNHYVNVHRTIGSQNFFEKEYSDTEQLLIKAETNLVEYKNKMKVISIDSKRDLLHKESQLLQDELLKTDADLTAKVAEIAQLDSMIAEQPEMMSVAETSRSNAASDSMRGDLYRLEIAESELSSKYGDENPKLIKARQALAEARASFNKQDSLFGEKAEAINPIRQDLLLTRMKAASMLESLRARQISLLEKVTQNEDRIQSLNGDEIRVAELNRAVDLSRDELRDYSRKREEARRQTELDAALISALQVSHPATHVIEKSGPPRLIGLGIIGIAAVLCSCALAIYRESTDSSVEDDLSPLSGYGGRLESFEMQRSRAGRDSSEEYTIISGRASKLANRKDDLQANGRRASSGVQVNVSENIRG